MKFLAFACLLTPLLLSSNLLHAETQYVSDDLRVPLRKTPCNRCAILHHGIKAGTPLTIIEQNNEGWSHVTTKSGLDGWMPSQYLVKQPIARYRLIRAEKQLAATNEKNKNLQTQLNELLENKQVIEAQLKSSQAESESTNSELINIRKISANSIAIHQQNEELLTKNSLLRGQLDILSATNEQLRSKERQNWFLYGGLAVFLGALLTVLIPRLKKKKTFSEWG